MTTDVKLFRFARQDRQWHYTSANRAISFAGNEFQPAAISHDRISDGGDSGRRELKITLPKNLDVCSNWWPWPPGDTIMATVWTLEDGEPFVDWIGRVISPRFNATTLELVSDPAAVSADHGSRGRVAQRGCGHILYDAGCQVDPAEHELPAVLTGVSGFTLSAPAFLLVPSGRLAGGWVQWEGVNGFTERRSINSHSGNTIVIDYGAAGLEPDLEVLAYPGCAMDWESCEYYENTDNYGGWLYRPDRDYFDGNPV